jgi:hypothetical protein
MSDSRKVSNQGEGDREAARRYNEATQEFVESGGVEANEKERREGESTISDELTPEEREAAEHAAEEDPAVHRDYSKPK